MKIAELAVSNMATFDANGRAAIRTAPQKAGEDWFVRRININTTSTSATIATTYRNYENPTSKLDSTRRGNDDTSEDNSYRIYAGGAFICVWTGGTPGAIATLNLFGDIEKG